MLNACGGGGGSSNVADPTANQSTVQPAKAPDAQINVQAAVLKTDVKVEDPALSKDGDQGFFNLKATEPYKIGQIFVFDKNLYKVQDASALSAGSYRLSTTPATLDEGFSNLKFSVKSHAVAYDDAGKVANVLQADRLRLAALPSNALDRFGCFLPSEELS